MSHDLSGAAQDLADAAGARLLDLRAQMAAADVPGAEAKERGDAGAQEVLARLLHERFPADGVLSEEAADNTARLGAQRVWIIDPLDGTREYSEYGRDDWAVHVAVWSAGELIAGAVALPARGVTYSTRSARPVTAASDGPIRLAVSRTRPPQFVVALQEQIGGTLVPMGSAGVKAMSVVGGSADAYVHAGGQYEWDSAAPVAVARAAGLHTSRIDGSALQYNNADPWLPDLLICRPELTERLLSEIAALT